MALQQEIWISQIAENIYPKNSFINFSTDHSEFVNFKVVHVPQAGAKPEVTKNRSSWPVTASQRTDADFTYQIDDFSTDAFFVTDVEGAQISYDKMNSVLKNATKALEKEIADNILYNWATSAFSAVTYTTGSDSSSALARNASGTRKALSSADFLALKKQMDGHDIPAEGRKLVLPSDMYNQALADADIKAAYAFGSATMPSGVVPTLYGFELIHRSETLSASSGGTIQIAGSSGASGDDLVAVAFHPDFVSTAKGKIDLYYEAGSALYQGDIMSARAFAGGKAMRSDGKGVYLLIQG